MDISDRVRAVVEEEVPEKRRTQALEAATGVAAETWRMFLSRRQKATEKMIEAVCKAWPKHAFWIGTGIADSDYGHWAAFWQFGEVGYYEHVSMFERAAMALALGSVIREVPLTREYADQVYYFYKQHLDVLRKLAVPWMSEVESKTWTQLGLSLQDYFVEWVEEKLRSRAVLTLFHTEAALDMLTRGEAEKREIARQAKLAEPEIKRRVDEEIARRAERLKSDGKA